MNTYQVTLNYRFDNNFHLDSWKGIVGIITEQAGFDDSSVFEVIIENEKGERREVEVSLEEIPQTITSAQWPDIHQVFLSNHWIKGMNVKLHLVKRDDNVNMTIKCDIEEPLRREILVKKTDSFIKNEVQTVEEGSGPLYQEREALFGTMLFTQSVAEATREYFLSGDLRACLKAAIELLQEKIDEKIHFKKNRDQDVLNLLNREIPFLLMPDMSGERLKIELQSLGHLIMGSLSLLQPLVKMEDKVFEEPARILKYLVIVSMIMESLESTIRNPAAETTKNKKTAPKTVKKKVIKKKTVKKLSKQIASVKGKKKSPQKTVKNVNKKKVVKTRAKKIVPKSVNKKTKRG